MNKDFLEFWGNIFLQAAKGQRQLEEAMKWVQLGTESIEAQRDFWNSFGAVKKEIENKPDTVEMWEKFLEDFLAWFQWMNIKCCLKRTKRLKKNLQNERNFPRKSDRREKMPLMLRGKSKRGYRN
jgi:hypothetical protein